jgi:hypothetical protein
MPPRYNAAGSALTNIAKSAIINNQVFDLPVHPGENSTYNLQFRGPQLRCTSLSYYNNTSPLEYYSPKEVGDLPSLVTPIFVSKWDWESRWHQDSQDAPLYTVATHEITNYTAQRTSKNETSFQGFGTTVEQSCKPYTVLYDVNVSFPRGIQTIQYSRSNLEKLASMMGYAHAFNISGVTMEILALPAEANVLQAWNDRMHTLLPLANQWALLDALGVSLEETIYVLEKGFNRQRGQTWCHLSSNSTNGTTFFNCDVTIGHSLSANATTKCKSTCLNLSDWKPDFRRSSAKGNRV